MSCMLVFRVLNGCSTSNEAIRIRHGDTVVEVSGKAIHYYLNQHRKS